MYELIRKQNNIVKVIKSFKTFGLAKQELNHLYNICLMEGNICTWNSNICFTGNINNTSIVFYIKKLT